MPTVRTRCALTCCWAKDVPELRGQNSQPLLRHTISEPAVGAMALARGASGLLTRLQASAGTWLGSVSEIAPAGGPPAGSRVSWVSSLASPSE